MRHPKLTEAPTRHQAPIYFQIKKHNLNANLHFYP
jgi:hypothetical protein